MALSKVEKIIDTEVEACVEIICQKGCQQTRKDLQKLQQDEGLAETMHLSDSQRQQVIQQLVDIMSVYGDSCAI